MASTIDPVCQMTVDSATAAAQSSYQSEKYYFCSDQCRQSFDKEPTRYLSGAEQRDAPYTATKSTAAPRFGSAGSGGLENEPMS